MIARTPLLNNDAYKLLVIKLEKAASIELQALKRVARNAFTSFSLFLTHLDLTARKPDFDAADH
jgi:hypothetical protein